MGLQLGFTAPDGTVWDLRAGAGPQITDDGMIGLGMPDIDFQTSKTPALDGQRLDGWSLKERAVFFPFKWHRSVRGDVEGVQRAWWRSHRIAEYGSFTVTDNSGKRRTIRCRFQDDGSRAVALDPYVPVASKWGETWIADDPWWFGDLFTARYQLNGAGNPKLFGANDYGPPFYINPEYSTGYVAVTNEGDEDAWPEWVVDGPTTAVDINVGGQHLTYNQTLAAGQRLLVLTRPDQQVAYLGTPGANADGSVSANTLAQDLSTLTPVTRTLAAVDFARIARGSVANVLFTVTGQGSVTTAFRPKYRTAY